MSRQQCIACGCWYPRRAGEAKQDWCFLGEKCPAVAEPKSEPLWCAYTAERIGDDGDVLEEAQSTLTGLIDFIKEQIYSPDAWRICRWTDEGVSVVPVDDYSTSFQIIVFKPQKWQQSIYDLHRSRLSSATPITKSVQVHRVWRAVVEP